jgi:putative transposase
MTSELRQRDEAWSRSLAVGSEEFVLKSREMLGTRGRSRTVVETEGSFILREFQEIYGGNFNPEKRAIALENSCLWDVIS